MLSLAPCRFRPSLSSNLMARQRRHCSTSTLNFDSTPTSGEADYFRYCNRYIVLISSFLFLSFVVTELKMSQRSKHLVVDNPIFCVASCCPRFKSVRFIKFKQLWFIGFPLYHHQFAAENSFRNVKLLYGHV